MKRRTLLKSVLGSAGVMSSAGCIGSITGDQVQDSDGDGVIDEQDYAPKDPDVQEKSDLQTTTQKSTTQKSSKGKEPKAEFTFFNRSPLDGYNVTVDITMGRAERIRIVYKNEVIGEFVGGNTYTKMIMGGSSDTPPAEAMARIAAVAKVDGEWKTITETNVIA